jgi:hypothetical protein
MLPPQAVARAAADAVAGDVDTLWGGHACGFLLMLAHVCVEQVFGVCGTVGTAYPEEFWNCADIRVTSREGTSARNQRRIKKSNVPAWEDLIKLESGLFGTPRVYRMGPPFFEDAGVAADAVTTAQHTPEPATTGNVVESIAEEGVASTTADAGNTATHTNIIGQVATGGGETLPAPQEVAEKNSNLDINHEVHPRKLMSFLH